MTRRFSWRQCQAGVAASLLALLTACSTPKVQKVQKVQNSLNKMRAAPVAPLAPAEPVVSAPAPDVPLASVDLPTAEPVVSAPAPDVPLVSAESVVSAPAPDVPLVSADLPTAEPVVSAPAPDVPLVSADLPSAEPVVSAPAPDVPLVSVDLLTAEPVVSAPAPDVPLVSADLLTAEPVAPAPAPTASRVSRFSDFISRHLLRRAEKPVPVPVAEVVSVPETPVDEKYRLTGDDALELERGKASWYGDQFHGRRTASGENYDKYALTAAHKTLPFGTIVRVRSLKLGREVDVRINDRGPFAPGRVIDLSQAAAEVLGLMAVGVAEVSLNMADTPGRKIHKALRKPQKSGKAPPARRER